MWKLFKKFFVLSAVTVMFTIIFT